MNANNVPIQITTNPDLQYIQTRTPKSPYGTYLFCNQYDDTELIYTCHIPTGTFRVMERKKMYPNELSTPGSTKITRDQWNRFITTMRLLSATILAAIPEDKATKYDRLYMETYQPSYNKKFSPTYTIDILRQRGIVMIAQHMHYMISKASETRLIPFNQLLKDRILKYQQELRNSAQNILGIK